MKFLWLFALSSVLFACSKNGADSNSQQSGSAALPRKVSYYQIDPLHPSESLAFNYDSLLHTVIVNSVAGTFVQPEALYHYNTDSFLISYESYNRLNLDQTARTIVIKRDQGNKVVSMITTAQGPSYQSDTAEFSYKYNGIYSVITVLTHGYLNNFQATDVYRLDTAVYSYIDSSHQLVSVNKGQVDRYLGYTTTRTVFSYKADGRIDSVVTTLHYNRDFGTSYVGTETTTWVRKYSYQPGAVVTGAKDGFKERLLGKDYYLAPLADLFYYNEKYRASYQFSDISLRMTPEPYISRTSSNPVSRIEINRSSDIYNFYSMPTKQLFNYTYTLGANGRIDGYQCNLVVDGTVYPEEKIVFEY